MGRPYNGHRSYNAWSVSLYLSNEYTLYRTMVYAVRNSRSKDEAAKHLAGILAGQYTPDGVRFTKTNIRLALRGIEA
jgi:hypothetical protein